MASSRLRRAPVLAVLALLAAPLLFSLDPLGLATETAEAQSATVNYVFAVRNPDGSFTVPHDWPLLPPGVDPGQTFRLLFVTS